MKVRKLIYDLLNDVYKNKAYANIALNLVIKENEIHSLDRAFLTNVFYGVLQNTLLLDYYIKKYTEGKKVDSKMKTLLKMSYYQMYFMDKIPDYAIINEAVEIAKSDLGIQASKFANAVLRSMQKTKLVVEKNDFISLDEYYSVLYSIPLWLFKMVSKHYGENVALNWAKKSKEIPAVALRYNKMKATQDKLLENSAFIKSMISSYGLIYKGNIPVKDTQEFKNGLVSIQDESGQLVAPFLEVKENQKILDMCAAPGSKTMHIAELTNDKCEIVAVDLYPHRLSLIKQSMMRLGIKNIKLLCHDSTKLSEKYPDNYFDRILLDAPCSGFGVIKRKPDIIIQAKQESLDGLIKLQRNLIDEAVKLLAESGILVYSTCTLNNKENEKQIEYLLNKHKNMHLLEQKLILPDVYDCDGFFMAKLIKGEEK